MKKGPIIAIVVGGVVLLGALVVIVIAVGLHRFARNSPEPQMVCNDPPTAVSATDPAEPGKIAIEVNSDGSISAWGETLDTEAFAIRLTALTDEFPNQSVSLRVDPTLRSEDVVELLDIFREAGIGEISLASETP